MCELFAMTKQFGIADLRAEMGKTLEEFGVILGISSKGHMSTIERGERPCSLGVALKIEELAGGRIDAASLCDDVRAARAVVQHDAVPSGARATESPDSGGDRIGIATAGEPMEDAA